jgi:CPA2 family monovalent cation:H+ antiporter-2
MKIIARTSGQDYFNILKDLGVSEAVFPEFEASLEMTRQSLLYLDVPPTEVQRHTDKIRQELYAGFFNDSDQYRMLSQLRSAEQQFDLQWIRLDQKSSLAHRSIGESEIRRVTGASVVGVVRDGQLKANPGADIVLMPGDLIAIIGGEKNRDAFCMMASSLPKQDNFK